MQIDISNFISLVLLLSALMKFIVQNISVLNSKAKQLILEETFKTYEQRPCLLKEEHKCPSVN